MKKEQVLELMNAIPPDLIEEADIQAPVKRRMPKVARIGLIAACLCLALIGTAAAIHFSGVSIAGGDDGFTQLKGGIAYYPYDSLSDQFKNLDGMQETELKLLVRPFDSWQAMEDFMGIDLMDNPVLDASPAGDFCQYWDGVYGKFMVITGSSLTSAHFYGCYQTGDVNITVDGVLFTDRHGEPLEDWDEEFYGFRYPEGTQMERDAYTAPSGLEAQLLSIYPGNHSDEKICLATFSLNGVPFWVRTYSCDMADARAALLQVLDGFILSE